VCVCVFVCVFFDVKSHAAYAINNALLNYGYI
jgi:hypothetical protein